MKTARKQTELSRILHNGGYVKYSIPCDFRSEYFGFWDWVKENYKLDIEYYTYNDNEVEVSEFNRLASEVMYGNELIREWLKNEYIEIFDLDKSESIESLIDGIMEAEYSDHCCGEYDTTPMW